MNRFPRRESLNLWTTGTSPPGNPPADFRSSHNDYQIPINQSDHRLESWIGRCPERSAPGAMPKLKLAYDGQARVWVCVWSMRLPCMKWLVVSPCRSQLRMLIPETSRKWRVPLKPDLSQIEKFGSFEEIEIWFRLQSHRSSESRLCWYCTLTGLMTWSKDSASVFSTELPICHHRVEAFHVCIMCWSYRRLCLTIGCRK
jgi:hypothetical protein